MRFRHKRLGELIARIEENEAMRAGFQKDARSIASSKEKGSVASVLQEANPSLSDPSKPILGKGQRPSEAMYGYSRKAMDKIENEPDPILSAADAAVAGANPRVRAAVMDAAERARDTVYSAMPGLRPLADRATAKESGYVSAKVFQGESAKWLEDAKKELAALIRKDPAAAIEYQEYLKRKNAVQKRGPAKVDVGERARGR